MNNKTIYPLEATSDTQRNEFYNRILNRVVGDLLESFPDAPFVAMVIKGAPARGEATIASIDEQFYSLSDIDLLVICSEPVNQNVLHRIRGWQKSLNENISPHISGIDMSFIALKDLQSLQGLISTHEINLSPIVIWGDISVLNSLPDVQLATIPPAESLIYFHNRVLEQLLQLPYILKPPAEERQRLILLYHTGKLILDLVTTFLYISRDIPAGYQQRVDRFVEYISRGTFVFSDPDNFLERLRLWNNFKKTGNPTPVYNFYNWTGNSQDFIPLIQTIWYETIPRIEPFWNHILRGMGFGIQDSSSIEERADCYRHLESTPRKVVRWIKTYRHPLVKPGWFSTARTLHLLLVASPRYLVYCSSLLCYLYCSKEYAHPQLKNQIKTYYPMRLPSHFEQIENNELALECIKLFNRYYRAILLGRMLDDDDQEHSA